MTSPPLEVLRTAAAAAAVVLAVLSRGDVLVLGALLVVVAWRLPALAVLPALVAASWRWGSTSLDALAGAQAVLGPAGFVGPTTAAAASWLAAVAILVSSAPAPAHVGGMRSPERATAAPNPLLARLTTRVGGMRGPERATDAPNLRLSSVAAGAGAAVVVAGPAAGGDLWIRVLAIVVASGAALLIGRARTSRPTLTRSLDALAALTSMAALATVARDAPAWAGTVDLGASAEGAAITLAVATLVVVTATLRAATPGQTA